MDVKETRKAKKEWLGRYLKHKREYDRLELELEELENDMTALKGSSFCWIAYCDPRARENRLVTIMDKQNKLYDLYLTELERWVDCFDETDKALRTIPKEQDENIYHGYLILRKYYISGLKHKEIAKRMKYSDKQELRLFNIGLDALDIEEINKDN